MGSPGEGASDGESPALGSSPVSDSDFFVCMREVVAWGWGPAVLSSS